MKILRIIYDWPPPWSGLAPHPYEITVAQTKLGHKIDVFCGRWPNSGDVQEPEGAKVHSIIREPIPGSLTLTSSILLLFRYISWRKHNEVDIIHAHGHFGIWIFLYRIILRKFFPWVKELKTPLVAHFHNTAKGRWVKLKEKNKITNPISEFFVFPMEVLANKLAIKAAAANVFVSEENKKEAIEYYGVEEKMCFVVEPGINTELFVAVGEEEKEKSRRDLSLDMYDKVIVSHGFIVKRKNNHLIVEALKYLPENYTLLLSGPGEEGYIDEIDEIIKKGNLKERVMKTGYTPYNEAPIVYQVGDIFVLPSEWEGMPKAVLESLACGVPTLVSGFKFSEEVPGVYYLENHDPKHIAERILDIVEKKEYVDFNILRERYSWEQRAKELEKVYEFAKKHYL
ncbi:glycosyltransferase family 4 protein [Patescibacteria group bacterium]|nr:glycosyltransferase family 4 protein [Patescibacteria group bacterium]